MHRPLVVALLVSVSALLAAPSGDAKKIAEEKKRISDILERMDAQDDPALITAVTDLANRAAAASPPSASDVKGASHIGQIKLEKTKQPATGPS